MLPISMQDVIIDGREVGAPGDDAPSVGILDSAKSMPKQIKINRSRIVATTPTGCKVDTPIVTYAHTQQTRQKLIWS